MGLLTWVRDDLAVAEHGSPRMEFLCISAGVVLNAVIAWISDPGSARDAALIGVAVAAFFVRGTAARLPAEVFAALVIGPIWVVTSQQGAPLEGTLFMSVIMVLTVASNSRSRLRPTVIMLVGATYPYLVNLAQEGPERIGWIAWTFGHVFTFVLGRVIRMLQDVIAELQRTRSALAEQAVAEERQRIARELHDLAGHTLAAMTLHVTGARHVLHRDPGEAERALADAETVGRRSLDQIRAAVSALRTTESSLDPAVSTGAELDDLVEEYRRAGLVVSAEIDDLTRAVDGPAAAALYRIAREALANVARHAPDNQVDLRATASDLVELTVRDRGRAPRTKHDETAHFGLTGMRERARALGGSLRAGPTDEGWEVVLRLPLIGETSEASDHDRAVLP